MDELLRCVPLNKVSCILIEAKSHGICLQEGLSQQELQQYWQVWWNEVTQRRNHGDFVYYPKLQLLSQVNGTQR